MTAPDAPSEQPETPEGRSSWMAFATMGMTVASCVAAGVLLGIWADSAWGTSPLMLFVGLLIGIGAGGASVVSQIRRFL